MALLEWKQDVWVSYACYNKLPQAVGGGALQTTETYCLTVLKARSPESRCQEGWLGSHIWTVLIGRGSCCKEEQYYQRRGTEAAEQAPTLWGGRCWVQFECVELWRSWWDAQVRCPLSIQFGSRCVIFNFSRNTFCGVWGTGTTKVYWGVNRNREKLKQGWSEAGESGSVWEHSQLWAQCHSGSLSGPETMP